MIIIISSYIIHTHYNEYSPPVAIGVVGGGWMPSLIEDIGTLLLVWVGAGCEVRVESCEVRIGPLLQVAAGMARVGKPALVLLYT